MKSAPKRPTRQALILGGVPLLLTGPTLWLLRAWLHIPVQPLSSTGGWQPLVAWFFLFGLVFGFFQRLTLRFVPSAAPPAAPPDLYTPVQAELASEHAAYKD